MTDARSLRTPGFPGREKATEFDAVLFGEFFRKYQTNIMKSETQGGVF